MSVAAWHRGIIRASHPSAPGSILSIPNNFNILANLIELMKRAGNISEAQKYLDNAE